MKNKPVITSLAFLLSTSTGGVLAGCSGGNGNPSTPGTAGTTGAAGRGGSVGSAGTSGSSGGGQSGTAGSGGNGTAGASAGAAGQAGTAGAGTAGSGGSSGQAGSGGTGVAGAAGGGSGSGGRGGGGAGTGGAGGVAGAAGRGGSAGGAGGAGGSVARYTCPSGPFTAPTPSQITLTKVTGVPPFDSFNNNGNNFGNIEGACWFSDALYVSEIGGGNNPPPSRILRATGTVGIAFPDSGTNGLAIDTMGRLIGANHKVGGIVAYNLTNMTSTPIVSTYGTPAARFNSPNDLTVRSDGTIYFTDPDFQAPSPRPQAMNRVYRVPPGSTTPTVVDAGRTQPNGITLSLDESTLYVADGQGLWKYPVNTDGTTGTATRIAQSAVTTGDGMGIDCMGNLYVASNQQVVVVNPAGAGTSLGTIAVTGVQSVTNIAFGGTNHQTLYITGLGNGMGGSAMGLYRADMPLPGMPF